MELLQAAAQQVPRGTADRRLVLNREPLELLLERPGHAHANLYFVASKDCSHVRFSRVLHHSRGLTTLSLV